jgi:hypothetical protein
MLYWTALPTAPKMIAAEPRRSRAFAAFAAIFAEYDKWNWKEFNTTWTGADELGIFQKKFVWQRENAAWTWTLDSTRWH